MALPPPLAGYCVLRFLVLIARRVRCAFITRLEILSPRLICSRAKWQRVQLAPSPAATENKQVSPASIWLSRLLSSVVPHFVYPRRHHAFISLPMLFSLLTLFSVPRLFSHDGAATSGFFVLYCPQTAPCVASSPPINLWYNFCLFCNPLYASSDDQGREPERDFNTKLLVQRLFCDGSLTGNSSRSCCRLFLRLLEQFSLARSTRHKRETHTLFSPLLTCFVFSFWTTLFLTNGGRDWSTRGFRRTRTHTLSEETLTQNRTTRQPTDPHALSFSAWPAVRELSRATALTPRRSARWRTHWPKGSLIG